MPNHLHAIVEICNENRGEANGAGGPTNDVNGTDMNGPTNAAGDPDMNGANGPTNGAGGPTNGANGPTNDANGPDTNVETHGRVSLPTNATNATNAVTPTDPIESIAPDLSSIKRNPPIRLPKSISSFLAGFKSAVNTKIDDYIDEHQLNMPKYNRYNHFFQPNYHDHIIRNHREYTTIANYIIQNPANWGEDRFYGKM